MTSLLSLIERSLDQSGLLSPRGQTVVAAVSGGADSLALLLAMQRLAQRRPLQVHAVHVNHRLRGAEGDDDADYVALTCDELSVPCTIEVVDVEGYQKSFRLSLEAAAREARYTALAKAADRLRASAIATGHTQDDQAETVLLHLLRGSGLRGLRGMLPVSRWRSRDRRFEAAVVRPLLEATHQETAAYCEDMGYRPRHDRTNEDVRFTRNRIRRQLLPILREYNPRVVETLAHLASSAARDVAYLDEQVQQVWPGLVTCDAEGLHIRRGELLALHSSMQAHLLQRAFAEAAGESAEFGFRQVERVLALAQKGAGRAADLGSGLRCHVLPDALLLTTVPLEPAWPMLREHALAVPGETSAQGWRIRTRLLPAADLTREDLEGDPYRACFDADAMSAPPLVRSRRDGDRFHPLGAPGGKKLKAFMIQERIPRHERNSVPLLTTARGVLWVVGYRIADWAKVTPQTRQALEVTFAREG